MCESPTRLPNGKFVPCHLCWQCRLDRVDDIVGRCIAESKTAVATHAVTLTYGRALDSDKANYGEPDHERAAFLTYSDVQKYVKLLRRHGYPLRYLVVGEYGSLKGRAHWHIIIFWQKKVPPGITYDKRFMHYRVNDDGELQFDESGIGSIFWPHGVSFFTNANYESIRYNCKYIQKDIGVDERQSHYSMSKKPPLGAAYFAMLAEKYVQQGLSPQGTGLKAVPLGTDVEEADGPGSFVYTFPDVHKTNGNRVEFRLRDVSLELFLQAFIDAWVRKYKNTEWPYSRLVEAYWTPDAGRDEREATSKFEAMERKWLERKETDAMHAALKEKLVLYHQTYSLAGLRWNEEEECFQYTTKANKMVFSRVLLYKNGVWKLGPQTP